MTEDPKKVAVEYKNMGNVLMQQSRWDEAIENFTKAIELDADNEKFYSNRALAYLKLKKYKRAAADGKKALSLKPDYVNGALRLADAEKGLKNYEAAIEAFRTALKHEAKQEKRIKISTSLEEVETLHDEQLKAEKQKEEERMAKAAAAAASSSQKEPIADAPESSQDLIPAGSKSDSAKTEEDDDESSFENEQPVQKVEVVEKGPPFFSKEGQAKFWNIGNIANAVAASIMFVGIIMLGTLGATKPTMFVFNAGCFAFSGGATNGIAIKMLFDKIPYVAGSGVIPSRFVEIREIVKRMIMKNFFDEVYLSYFIKKKLLRMDFERMVNDLLAKHDISHMLVEMAFEDPAIRDSMESMIKPYINEMAKKIGPLITQSLKEVDFSKGIGSAQGELELMLDTKLKTLTPESVKKMIEDIIREHLYWLVLWGAVFGGILGIISAALDLP